MSIKDNLISWWELNETSGNRSDSHGSNTLTDNNSVLFGTGKQGNAADFEETNTEFLDIADNASLSFANEDFSLGCWFKPETLPGATLFLMGKWGNAGVREYGLRVNASDVPQFVVSNDGTATASVGQSTVSDGNWSLIVCGHDSVNDLIKISVNAAAFATAAHSTGSNDGAADFVVGARNAGAGHTSYADGLLDEAFVYRKLVTQAEVSFIYHGGLGRAYSGLTVGGMLRAFYENRYEKIHGILRPKKGFYLPDGQFRPI